LTGTIERAHAEWDYRHVENQFGDTSAVAIPCQLRFSGSVKQDTEAFHDALRSNGYEPVDHEPGKNATDKKPHYEGEIASKEHYNRVKVLVFRGGVVRLYPHDDYVPTVEELSEIMAALEAGFGSELDHDPIERTRCA
jgi:hypothetical protein